jgi:hypothetical protein
VTVAILRERQRWTKPRPVDKPRRSSDLTPEEQTHAKAALRQLYRRFGSWTALAEAMQAKTSVVKNAVSKRRHVSAGITLRAARVAGVPLEDILTGAWPKPGSCPTCGRC